MKRARPILISVLLGGAVAFGQAPFGLWPLAFVALVLIFGQYRTRSFGKGAFGQGFWTGFGYALLAMHWIVEPFLVDAATYGWMAPFGLVGMAAGFGVFWGVGFWIGTRLSGGAHVSGLAFGWTLAEFARSFLFTGFPWVLVGHIWIDTPVYKIAAILGPLGLSLLTLGLAAALWHLWETRDKVLGAAVLLVLALVQVPLWQLNTSDGSGTGTVLRLIQPNAAQHLKWSPEWAPKFFKRQLEFSAAEGDPDMVIWPEVAVTFRLDDPSAPFDRISNAVGPRPVILGGLRVEEAQVYNTMLVLDAEGIPVSLYDKHHLVPFGEYAPGGELARRMGFRGLAEQLTFGFSSGPEPKLMTLPGGLTVLPMICYEAIFPHELRRAGPERPDFLLHMTNDAWFGDWAGPEQHLAQAKARAVEFGLPVVRVANTGISGVIGPDGAMPVSLPLGQAGWLDLDLPSPHPATFYWRFGDSPAGLVLIVLGAVLMWRRRRNLIDQSANNL